MKSKFYTVLKKDSDGLTMSRIGSFTDIEIADELACSKRSDRTQADLDDGINYDVVQSDLYETLDEFYEDEIRALVASARKKLTADEWSAVKNFAERFGKETDSKTPIEVTMPLYFEDDQECGYCKREIGQPHRSSCRQ